MDQFEFILLQVWNTGLIQFSRVSTMNLQDSTNILALARITAGQTMEVLRRIQ